MKYAFHAEAKTEFVLAIEYYEEREPGLGHEFAVEVYSAVERAAANPEMWPCIAPDIRRCLVRRFPYGILYGYNDSKDGILIVAIMHLHREPHCWEHRS